MSLFDKESKKEEEEEEKATAMCRPTESYNASNRRLNPMHLTQGDLNEHLQQLQQGLDCFKTIMRRFTTIMYAPDEKTSDDQITHAGSEMFVKLSKKIIIIKMKQ